MDRNNRLLAALTGQSLAKSERMVGTYVPIENLTERSKKVKGNRHTRARHITRYQGAQVTARRGPAGNRR